MNETQYLTSTAVSFVSIFAIPFATNLGIHHMFLQNLH